MVLTLRDNIPAPNMIVHKYRKMLILIIDSSNSQHISTKVETPSSIFGVGSICSDAGSTMMAHSEEAMLVEKVTKQETEIETETGKAVTSALEPEVEDEAA